MTRNLNSRNIRTVRYIDDFVILGRSENAVQTAFSSAISILGDLGMKAYDPDENTDKSKVGQVSDGFDFLGCSIQANSVMPSKKARKSFLRNIRYTLNTGSHAITAYASADNERRAEEAFAQVIVRVDRLIRGWGDAFSFTNNRLPFHQIDSEINRMLREFKGRANHCINSAVIDDRRHRALGVALLKDTPRLPIEELVDQVVEA